VFDLDPLSMLPDMSVADEVSDSFAHLLNEGAPKKVKLTESEKAAKSDLAIVAEDAKKIIEYLENDAIDLTEANQILARMTEYLDKVSEKVIMIEESTDNDQAAM